MMMVIAADDGDNIVWWYEYHYGDNANYSGYGIIVGDEGENHTSSFWDVFEDREEWAGVYDGSCVEKVVLWGQIQQPTHQLLILHSNVN